MDFIVGALVLAVIFSDRIGLPDEVQRRFYQIILAFVLAALAAAWRAEDVVRLKRAAPAPVSYTFIQKRLRWFGLTAGEQFKGVQFQKLEERLYGRPFYKYSTV